MRVCAHVGVCVRTCGGVSVCLCGYVLSDRLCVVVCGVRLYRCGLVVVWLWLRHCGVERGWLMFGDCCITQLLYV